MFALQVSGQNSGVWRPIAPIVPE